MLICVSKLTTTGSDIGLATGRHPGVGTKPLSEPMLEQTSFILIQNVVGKVTTILSRLQCVKVGFSRQCALRFSTS